MPAPTTLADPLAPLAAALGPTAAWTLPGQAARWTDPTGVELVADTPDRGSLVHLVPADDGPVRTFDPGDDPADIAAAVTAARCPLPRTDRPADGAHHVTDAIGAVVYSGPDSGHLARLQLAATRR